MTTDDSYADFPGMLPEESWKAAMREELLDLCGRDYARLVRFVMRAGADLGQAEDAVQEAFLAAWRYQRKGEESKPIDNLSAWLHTVALNCYRRPPGRKRRSSGDRVITEILVEGPAETVPRANRVDQVELSAQAMAVREALQTLPEQQRFVMAFLLDGFTLAETARELKIDEQKARGLVRGARRTLKKQLSAEIADYRKEG